MREVEEPIGYWFYFLDIFTSQSWTPWSFCSVWPFLSTLFKILPLPPLMSTPMPLSSILCLCPSYLTQRMFCLLFAFSCFLLIDGSTMVGAPWHDHRLFGGRVPVLFLVHEHCKCSLCVCRHTSLGSTCLKIALDGYLQLSWGLKKQFHIKNFIF